MTIAQPFDSLIAQSDPDSLFGFRNGRPVSQRELLAHAVSVSRRLPDAGYAINLCRDRYLFTVAYLAVIIRNQVNLLPSSQSSGCIRGLSQQYPDSYRLTDETGAAAADCFVIDEQANDTGSDAHPLIDPARVISLSFTSGSTGKPRATVKTWAGFVRSARLAVDRLGLNDNGSALISTVPAQHMYGLESSVFWPLVSGAAISNRHPFFPLDIDAALQQGPLPAVLITTPTHLKHCVESSIRWKNVAMVLSSTAPMPLALARQVETAFNAPLFEIFGSTETLSYASRRPTETRVWTPYEGIRVFGECGGFAVHGGHLDVPVPLDDLLEIDPDGRFTVTGRSSDVVKIAGKRASLADLNATLNTIEGVEEGCFYRTESERLGALVVTHLDNREIQRALRKSIDAVFLPRPLHRVSRLPRNATGKLPKSEIERLVKELDLA